MMGEGCGISLSRCVDLVSFSSLILPGRSYSWFPEKGTQIRQMLTFSNFKPGRVNFYDQSKETIKVSSMRQLGWFQC